MSAETPTRQPVAARRTGYAIAVAINVVLLFLLNGRPGWNAVPFLTDGSGVLPWINAALGAAVAVNLIYLFRSTRRVVAAGGLLTTGLGLVVLVRLWQVFPFDFGGDSGWSMAVRALLMLAAVGSVIAIPVQIVALVRPARRG